MALIMDPYITKLNSLSFKKMYNNDFFLTWEKTFDEILATWTVADALRTLREANISTKIFESGLGISLFRDNSTRTRFSFASACNLLGLEVQDLDEGKSQIAHGETVRETANMVSFMADVSFFKTCEKRPGIVEAVSKANVMRADMRSAWKQVDFSNAYFIRSSA